jgi:hypothetical protein
MASVTALRMTALRSARTREHAPPVYAIRLEISNVAFFERRTLRIARRASASGIDYKSSLAIHEGAIKVSTLACLIPAAVLRTCFEVS